MEEYEALLAHFHWQVPNQRTQNFLRGYLDHNMDRVLAWMAERQLEKTSDHAMPLMEDAEAAVC